MNMTTLDSPRARLRCAGLALLIACAHAASAQAPAETPTFKDLPRATPRTLLAPSTVKASPTPAGALEPWPLRVELAAGERSGAGFTVSRSGPIRVTLQASGAPLVLSLVRPDGRTVERTGSGTLQIDDAATDADIQRGVIWRVGVRPQQDAKPAPAGTVRAAVATRVVATGSLSVQHPGADPARAQAALASAAAQAEQTKQRAIPAAAPLTDTLQINRQAQAQLDLAVAQRHAATLEKLRPSVPADVQGQLQQRISLRLQGQSLQQAASAAPVRLITRSVDAPVAEIKRAAPGRLLAVPAVNGGATASSSSASTGVAPVGSTGAAATALPPPQIASSSASEGDPGTPVSVSGSNFGDAPGEVRFIVGNGRDIAAPVTYWSAAQIVTEVPYADGLPIYDGQVYVKRADGQRSPLQPFRFIPLYDVTTIGLPVPRMEWKAYTFDSAPVQQLSVSRMIEHGNMSNPFDLIFGGSGYVQYYQSTRLKNGWLVDGAAVTSFGRDGPYVYQSAGAYITELRAGTDSPFVKIRWWRDAGSVVGYDLRISLKRPRALACANPCVAL